MTSAVEAHYDYVIVGGGSAGCVLANRLTEDPACRVLLLEAGGTASTPLVELAFGFAKMLNNPKYDWRFEVGPEAAAGDRTMTYPRGKVLGGSSSINAMLYVRGLRRDYDAWAGEGLAGWGWDDVEPYLRKLEDYAAPSPNPRGRGGPVKVTPTPNFHPLSRRILEASAQSIVGRTEDYNGAEPSGLGQSQMFYRDGRRSGSAAAYIKPVRSRPNLRIELHATAESIRFEGRRAVGVRYRQNGRVSLAGGGEIILCAGAIGTPQLLEVSGVGDPGLLIDKGVTPIHHLSQVGENLHDHFLVLILQALKGDDSLGREMTGWRAGANLLNYLLFGRGWMNGAPTQVCGHADVTVDGAVAGLQFMGMPLSFARNPKTEAIEVSANASLMLGVNVCHPHSRGHVHIAGPTLDEAPEIVANFLSDPRDLAATVAGMRLCRDIIGQPALDPVRAEEIGPGATAQTDAALAAYARAAGASAYHPVGSCRMANDPAAGVVDARLRVHGLTGLRVVDASVMPRIVSANTHAPTVMIAEKAADMIRADRRS